MPSHIRIHAKEGERTKVDLDVVDPADILALTVECLPGHPPRVVIELDPATLDIDLWGIIDVPMSDRLREVLADWEADPGRSEAAAVERAALSEAKGLRGIKGDTALGFLRALVNALDAAGA